MSPAPASSRTTSSLELMLEEIQKREDEEHQQKNNLLPALPTRPLIKSRLPVRSRHQILPLIRFGGVNNNNNVDCFYGDPPHQGMRNMMSHNIAFASSTCRSAAGAMLSSRNVTWREDYTPDSDDDEDEGGSVDYEEDRSSSSAEEVAHEDIAQDNEAAAAVEVVVEQSSASEVVNELRMRVVKTEVLLEQKTEENATLQQQLNRLERKRQHYESKMKSMETYWQDQLNSLQISLAAAAAAAGKRNNNVNNNPYNYESNCKGKKLGGMVFGDTRRTLHEKIDGFEEVEGGITLISIREYIDKERRHEEQTSYVALKQKYKALKNEIKRSNYFIYKIGNNVQSPSASVSASTYAAEKTSNSSSSSSRRRRRALQLKGRNRILCF